MLPINKQFTPVGESEADKEKKLSVKYCDEGGHEIVKMYTSFETMFEDLPEGLRQFFLEGFRRRVGETKYFGYGVGKQCLNKGS